MLDDNLYLLLLCSINGEEPVLGSYNDSQRHHRYQDMHQVDETTPLQGDASVRLINKAVDVRPFARDVSYFGCILEVLSDQRKKNHNSTSEGRSTLFGK